MKTPYVSPSLHQQAFNCPNCGAYANQHWGTGCHKERFHQDVEKSYIARCMHCDEYTFWYNEMMIYPDHANAPMPNSDLPEEIKIDYLEARSVAERSPRGAAALLRLCIQKLCKSLGESGENINSDIAALVRKGLHPTIQKSLDIVRVVGNESVHPGQLDLRDDHETASELFTLVNLIAETMISQPKAVEALYAKLPQDKRDAIEKRDK